MLVFLKKIIKVFLFVIAIFTITNITFAQSSDASINLDISPSNPRSGVSVVLTLTSDLIDLSSSKILWYINGVVRKETTNQSITIKTSDDGLPTTVRVLVETSDGLTKEIIREISPVGIDLIVEPVAYTMPFYKGKPYMTGQGSVRVIALPDISINGVKIATKDLNFRWTRGESILGANSGKGKNSIILNSTIPVRDISVGVQVLDDSGNILAETSKIIFLNTPKILFYENSPLYGIFYNKAIVGNYYLGTREELKVIAKPFSFSFNKDTSSEANYAWYVNKSYVAPDEKTNELILKQTNPNLKGTASILVNLKHSGKINQYTSGGFNIDFGE